jgi:hypothetical protein
MNVKGEEMSAIADVSSPFMFPILCGCIFRYNRL